MDNEQEEQQQARKIRVVDKRISSRKASESDTAATDAAADRPASATEPPSDAPGAPQGAGAAREEPATVTPLRPAPPERDHAPGGATTGAAAAAGGASEDRQQHPSGPPSAQGEGVWTPEQEQEARRMSEEMSQIPSLEWVINVAVTLANAAGTKLNTGRWDDAGLAIDALSAIIEKVGSRMGEAETPLRQTLAQLQMAYAQMAAGTGGPPPSAP